MSSLAIRNNQWQLDFYHCGQRVRANSGLPATPANRARAQKMLDSALTAAARGDNPRTLLGLRQSSTEPTLSAFADRWLDQQAPAWRLSTVRTRKNSLSYLLRAFGNHPLSELNRADLLDWRANLLKCKDQGGQNLSANTVNRVMRGLGPFFVELMEQHPQLPLGNLKTLLAKVRGATTPITPFSADEIKTLQVHVPEHWRTYLQMRIETALRSSEIDALRWQDVDLANGRIAITTICVRGQRQSPKTAAGVRQLQLSDDVAAQLRALRAQDEMREMVFITERGLPLSENHFAQQVWVPLLALCNLPYRRPHVLRHTYATNALASGVPLNRLAARLGHSSIGPLVSVYAHLIPEVPDGAPHYL